MTWVFVYGTLRTGGGAESYLSDGVVDRQPAVLPGHALYGRQLPYPFAVPDTDSAIVGEAVRLDPRFAPSILAALDVYEGDEYRRIRHRVILDDGEVNAHLWVAVEGDRLPESERILTGDWFRRDL
jgi:gamma-glutamylcyclotransferase (GGCT)/AIG2-like uncharacterized protein YtfP